VTPQFRSDHVHQAAQEVIDTATVTANVSPTRVLVKRSAFEALRAALLVDRLRADTDAWATLHAIDDQLLARADYWLANAPCDGPGDGVDHDLIRDLRAALAGTPITDRPVRIPRDLAKRRDMYEFAGLTDAERLAIDKWCAAEQRAYEARLRRAMEKHDDDPTAAAAGSATPEEGHVTRSAHAQPGDLAVWIGPRTEGVHAWVTILDRRKDDGSGWWLRGSGGGLADSVLDEQRSSWIIVPAIAAARILSGYKLPAAAGSATPEEDDDG
jgi:hypothetical protein